jgi:hypothetical protein
MPRVKRYSTPTTNPYTEPGCAVITRDAVVGPSFHFVKTHRVSVVADGTCAVTVQAEPVAQFNVTGVV